MEHSTLRVMLAGSMCHGTMEEEGVERCARTEENNLAFYVKMSNEQFLDGVKISNILNYIESK